MPRMIHMTWIASQHRWTKMYKGTRYYISPKELGTLPTQADSLPAANAWWEAKRAEIDGASKKPVPGSPAAQKALLEAWAGQPMETTADAAILMSDLLANITTPIPPEVTAAFLGPAEAERLKQGVATLLDAPPALTERSVGTLANTWLGAEANRVRAGKLGLSRQNMNRILLMHFVEWLHRATPVEEINEAKWLAWYNFLGQQVQSGIWAVGHVDRMFGVSKRFVKFLWEMRLLDLPRNLENRNFSFAVPPQTITTWEVAEIQKLLSIMTGQSRLHVYLMLNCGFTGIDVSDLRQDEVDWNDGIITRKRSKTRDVADVPVVRYKLWDRTFALLQEYRSQDTETVLLTTTGKKWIEEHDDGEYHRSDKVASNFKYWMKRAKIKKPPKALRATAATMLGEHPQFKYYAPYFLGHSPRTVAEKSYIKPSESEFFKALAWLEKALRLDQEAP